ELEGCVLAQPAASAGASAARRTRLRSEDATRDRPLLVWESTDRGRPQFDDAFREGAYYDHIDEVPAATARHRTLVCRAFDAAELFGLPVGLIEIWRVAADDTVLARYPRNMEPALIRSEVLIGEQNVQALDRALTLLIEHNPRIQLIVTGSPVPLYATFQGDTRHVVVATQHAKSVLNVALH